MLILVRPHQSYLDGLVVAWWLARKRGCYRAIFAVDPDFARHRVWSWLLRRYGSWVGGHTMVALDTNSPFALRTLLRELREHRIVVLFPQGTGLREGAQRPDKPGWQWLARKSCAQVLALEMVYSRFSVALLDTPQPAKRAITTRLWRPRANRGALH